MDKATIETQIELVETNIAMNLEAMDALQEVLTGLQKLRRLISEDADGRQLAMLPKVTQRGHPKPKGRVSFQKGLVEALQEVDGAPLEVEEIWERMQRLGVQSDAKKPIGFIGLTAKRVPSIEKVTPRIFRWAGRKDGRQVDSDAQGGG